MGRRKEFTNRLKFRYILCEARRLAHHSCSRASAHFLPALVRVRFPPPQSPGVQLPQRGGLPVWEVPAKLGSGCGGARGAPSSDCGPGVPIDHLRNLCAQPKRSCSENQMDFFSISFASLNVFTLAPGAFPIRSTLCGQKLVAQVQHPGRRGVEGAGA